MHVAMKYKVYFVLYVSSSMTGTEWNAVKNHTTKNHTIMWYIKFNDKDNLNLGYIIYHLILYVTAAILPCHCNKWILLKPQFLSLLQTFKCRSS